MASRARRLIPFFLGPWLLLCPSAEAHAQQRDPDPRVERWLEQARAALGQTPPRASRVRRARRWLARAAAEAPENPAIAEVAALRLPATAAEAAALPEAERDERAEWVLGLLDGLEPASADASRRTVERVRGWALAVRGEHEQALEILGAGLGVHDRAGADALRRLAALLIGRDELALADRALVFARRAWATDAELVADLAAVRVARGAPTSAVRLLRSELQHHPEDGTLREDLAGALLAAGRGAEALRLWRALAETRGDDPAVYTRLRRAAARAGLELGQPETARVEARRALGVRPDDGEARLLLGLALAAQGHPGPAREALLRARALLGDDLRVERALEALEGAAGEGPPAGAERGET